MVIKGYTPSWHWGRDLAPAYFLDCVKAEYSGEPSHHPTFSVVHLLVFFR